MQELNDPKKVLSTWVKHLHVLVDKLNNLKDVIELKEVPLVESYSPEDTLLEDGLYLFYYNLEKSTMTSARETLTEK